MKKCEMSTHQLKSVRHFNVIMDTHGWEDLRHIEEDMDKGMNTIPEGEYTWTNLHYQHTLQLHIPLGMLRLQVVNQQTGEEVLWLMFYRFQPQQIASWIGQHPELINTEELEPLMDACIGECEAIILQDTETELYEIRHRRGQGRPCTIEPLTRDPQTGTPIVA